MAKGGRSRRGDEPSRGGHIAQIPRVNNGFARPQSSLLVNLNAIDPAPTVHCLATRRSMRVSDRFGPRNPESVPAQHPEAAATVRKISGLCQIAPWLSACKPFGPGTNGAFPTGGPLVTLEPRFDESTRKYKCCQSALQLVRASRWERSAGYQANQNREL